MAEVADYGLHLGAPPIEERRVSVMDAAAAAAAFVRG
jgi:hypothetical protein